MFESCIADEGTRAYCGNLMAMSLLPPEHVRPVFDQVTTPLLEDEQFQQLATCCRNTWIDGPGLCLASLSGNQWLRGGTVAWTARLAAVCCPCTWWSNWSTRADVLEIGLKSFEDVAIVLDYASYRLRACATDGSLKIQYHPALGSAWLWTFLEALGKVSDEFSEVWWWFWSYSVKLNYLNLKSRSTAPVIFSQLIDVNKPWVIIRRKQTNCAMLMNAQIVKKLRILASVSYVSSLSYIPVLE